MSESSVFRNLWLPCIAVAASAIVVYGLSLQNGFVFFDDDKAILYNKALQNPSLGKFFSGQNLGMYAPFTWIAYWIGHGISGEEAWGYHLLGLFLHATNACLVFLFLQGLTRQQGAALVAALLFALHPIQVEAVSWAAALSTVLFTTLYLKSLLTYIYWKDSGKKAHFWYFASVLAFFGACLSKSAAVTLPLVLLALDYYWIKRGNGTVRAGEWRAALLNKIPYFAGALIFGLYTIATREQEGHDIAATSSVFSLADRFFMVCQTLLFYPVKILIPIGFSISYPFVKMDGVWPWTYYAAPLILLAGAYFIWKYARTQPDILLGLALYLLPLTVMLPYRTVGSFELRSDRYVYFSCIGLFFLLGLGMERLKPTLRTGLLLGLAAVLAFLTFQQTKVWSSGVRLFENCTKKTPEASLCQCNLAYNQLITNDYQGAVKHYSASLEYDPATVEAYNGRGQAYFQLRKYPEALADFTKAIQAGIVTPKLFLNRGKCLVILNRAAEAIPDLNRSVELEPKSPETYYFRAVAYEKGGDIERALDDYGQAIALNPNYVEALVNRGLLRVKAAQFEASISDYTAALGMSVQEVHPMILNNRAFAYLKSGQLAKALEDTDKALKINPNYPFAYNTRAAVYQQMGDFANAQADLAKAQQLQGR